MNLCIDADVTDVLIFDTMERALEVHRDVGSMTDYGPVYMGFRLHSGKLVAIPQAPGEIASAWYERADLVPRGGAALVSETSIIDAAARLTEDEPGVSRHKLCDLAPELCVA